MSSRLKNSHVVLVFSSKPAYSGEGHDLLSGESVLVPYEMVHTNYTTPFPDGHGCFPATSNGLASGNRVVEAISHGVCEVIERDATTLWNLRDDKHFDQTRLDLTSVDDPICQELLRKFEGAGLSVAVWDITSDIAIAALRVSLFLGTTTGCGIAR
jgi:ribosomal protein S12 methylthiotransferase accessory factor